jgi:hypothetical protein
MANAPNIRIFIDTRLVSLYTFECDLSGWEDPEVHNDPFIVRKSAANGANILNYVFKIKINSLVI